MEKELNINFNDLELNNLKENLDNLRFFIYEYIPIRLQEIFSEINAKYGLNVIGASVLNGKLLIICSKRFGNTKAVLSLNAPQDVI